MIKFFVERPLFTASAFIILAVIGLFSYSNLALDLLPDMSLPSISIITVYSGASAEDIETTVTKYIEDAVSTAPNLDKITSNSAENMSTVTVSFKWGTNLDAATSDIRDKLDLIKSKLPDNIQNPTIYKFDMSMIPVLQLGITADKSYDDLYQIADKKIGQVIKHIQGVGSIGITGGKQRQINVDIDRNRLDAYKLPLSQVIGMLQASNITVPAGSLKVGGLQYSVRIPAEYKSIKEISDTIVGSYMGADIYLRDIAQVSDSFVEPDNIVKVNGVPGVMMTIQKQSGANTVNVSRDVQKQLVSIFKDLPSDVKYTIISDTAESIGRSIDNLRETLLWGLVFVILTVFFYLRNFRGSLIISMAIPFSLLAAFIYLYLTNGSINIVSLAAIVIAIGMVVDDAIVVLEKIYTHRDQKDEPLKEASIFGTGEVSGAVLASTTTNLVVFVPVVMISGFVAIFFKQLSFTIMIVMGMSYIVSMSLTPMLSSRFLEVRKNGDAKGKGPLQTFYRRSEGIFNQVEDGYHRLLGWALGHRRTVIYVALAIFFLSLPIYPFLGSEFFPSQDSSQISAYVQMPIGTRWEETTKAMEKIEKLVKQNVPEAQYEMITAGSSQNNAMMTFFGAKSGSNYGRLLIKLVHKEKRKRSTDQIQRFLADKITRIPGIKSVDFTSTNSANTLLGGGKPVSVEIYGFSIEDTGAVAQQLQEKMSKVPGIVDLTVSREKSNPEVWFEVDREKASALGLSMAEVASNLRNNLYGNATTKYRDAGDEYDIFLRLREENRRTLDDLKSIFVTNRFGKNIALSNIANIEYKNGPLSIERKNQERLVKVEANTFNRSVGDINGDVQRIISKMALPNGVSIKMAGSAEQMKESFGQLGQALFIGIILIYLVMVAQFESLINPFIIMFSIPFALVGVIWALFIFGIPFGLMAFIGVIMVVGIVVKNAIVLIDYINILRARGLSLMDAIQSGGRSRLRPILMTSSATLLGILPIILNQGEGAEFWKPLGFALFGGLLISTMVTLIFVPVMYSIFEERMKKRELMGRVVS